MLTPYLNSQLVEKVLTDRFGRQFRCLFLVAVVDGEIKGKLVSAQSLESVTHNLRTATSKFYLPSIKKPAVVSQFEFLLPILGYFAPKDFSFVMSQMIRAPSF